MRTVALFFSAFFLSMTTLAGQVAGDDPYAIKFVRANLHTGGPPDAAEIPAVTKGFQRLGDGVAIALLKILDQQHLTDPETVKAFLPLIQKSFSYPSIISIETNKKPSVTLFLLTYLQGNISDPSLRQEVQRTIDFIERKTNGLTSP